MSHEKKPRASGIVLKKHHGQYFLRDRSVTFDMLCAVDVKNKSVIEIGCGDGFLTREILGQPIERLWIFEIDTQWATKVQNDYPDARMRMFCGDFLTVDLTILKPHAPWTVLANLPYHITFPILYKLHEQRDLIECSVLMMQEEVAQKIAKTRGR